MKFVVFAALLIVALNASEGTPPRGKESERLANAMGANLDLGPVNAATDAWKASQGEYEKKKADIYQKIEGAAEEVKHLQGLTEKLDSAKEKKNVEDSKIEQKGTNYLAMQMIKERKATKVMAAERDDALTYVPRLKKHQQEQLTAAKDAAAAEADQLNARIKEEQQRRTNEVNAKLEEIKQCEDKAKTDLDAEKERTAQAVQQGQANVQTARGEADAERTRYEEKIQNINAQSENDIKEKDSKIAQLEAAIEQTRKEGEQATADAKQKAATELQKTKDAAATALSESEARLKAQITKLQQQLEASQGEYNDCESKNVADAAEHQQALAQKQKQMDEQVTQLKGEQKQQMSVLEQKLVGEKETQIKSVTEAQNAKVVQVEQTAEQRIANLKDSQQKSLVRVSQQKADVQKRLDEEGKNLDACNSQRRQYVAKVEELKQYITDENDRTKQAASQMAQNAALTQNALPTVPLATANTATTAGKTNAINSEAQVGVSSARPNSPINKTFVGLLISVNVLLGLAAVAYYSEKKRLTNFTAGFMEEF